MSKCICCEVEFNSDFPYSQPYNNGTELCYWCSLYIPCGIIDIIEGKRNEYGGFNKTNYKEHSLLADRIKSISKPSSLPQKSCPRCGEELKEKISIGLNETILKCNNCGWC